MNESLLDDFLIDMMLLVSQDLMFKLPIQGGCISSISFNDMCRSLSISVRTAFADSTITRIVFNPCNGDHRQAS